MVEAGDKLNKAGIDIADHALLRTAQRASPEQVINTYQQGTKYLDTLYNNTNLFKDGLRLSIDGAGKIITVIEQKAMNPERFTPLK